MKQNLFSLLIREENFSLKADGIQSVRKKCGGNLSRIY
ncbi:unknown [[Mannheimia] succiniciproducens MBEL55E]|uniref:Uncharacterized protein n=1 Tax=Mannheimia succiniciproducens (strain KCTC 0769BP / MBEL55E) TaxID=221988 RepID=Q65TA3_MANSM|nr:unknown [[Mannheimia] succiniciproducens MBEL55E]